MSVCLSVNFVFWSVCVRVCLSVFAFVFCSQLPGVGSKEEGVPGLHIPVQYSSHSQLIQGLHHDGVSDWKKGNPRISTPAAVASKC